jgi:methyl-accepting chemotaxis protein
MTVGSKLALGFAILVAIIGVLAAYGAYRDDQVASAVARLYENGAVATQELGRASRVLQKIRGRMFYHAGVTDTATMDAIQRELPTLDAEYLEALRKAEAAFGSRDLDRQFAEARERFVIYASLRDREVLPVSRSGDTARALSLMMTLTRQPFDDTAASLDDVTNRIVDATRELHDRARATIARGQQIAVTGSVAALGAAILVGLLLSRSITQRIVEVARVARVVSSGGRESARVEGNDEVSALATDFNRMTDELARRIDEQSAAREELARAVSTYARFVERVAKGDLAAEVGAEGSGDLGKLGENLAAMGKALRRMTEDVRTTVGSLSTATQEISATTQEQSASAAESAAAVAETVATVDEVTQSAQHVADRARAVANGARESVQGSAAGRDAVERTVAAMDRAKEQVEAIAARMLALSEQAQAIGQVIGTVNELAEQSNLLALNAAIEAARAGEHGRGFAIVAQEVRALAEQSKRATAQVRSLLGDVQRSTATAVLATEEGNKAVGVALERVREAGGRIEQLASVIDTSAMAAEQILAAAEQQVTGVGQISRAMHSIDQATAQTVEGTRQAERAARELNELALRLRDTVAQYRT